MADVSTLPVEIKSFRTPYLFNPTFPTLRKDIDSNMEYHRIPNHHNILENQTDINADLTSYFHRQLTPLYASNASFNFICTMPRNTNSSSDLIHSSEPIAPWNIGILPQTITFSDYDEEELLNSKPEGNPVEVIEVGSTAKLNSIYEIKPIAILLISDSIQSNVIWKVIAASTDDPALDSIECNKESFVGDVLCWYLTRDLFSKSHEMSKKNGMWLDAQEAWTMVEESHRLWKMLNIEKAEMSTEQDKFLNLHSFAALKTAPNEEAIDSHTNLEFSPNRKFRSISFSFPEKKCTHYQLSQSKSQSMHSKISKKDSLKGEKKKDNDDQGIGCFGPFSSKSNPNQKSQRKNSSKSGSQKSDLDRMNSVEKLFKCLHNPISSSSISVSSSTSDLERMSLLEKEINSNIYNSLLSSSSSSLLSDRWSSFDKNVPLSSSPKNALSTSNKFTIQKPMSRKSSLEKEVSHLYSLSPPSSLSNMILNTQKAELDRKSSFDKDILRPNSPNSTLSLSTHSSMSSCEEKLILEFIDNPKIHSLEVDHSESSLTNKVVEKEHLLEQRRPNLAETEKVSTKSHKRWALLRSALSFDTCEDGSATEHDSVVCNEASTSMVDFSEVIESQQFMESVNVNEDMDCRRGNIIEQDGEYLDVSSAVFADFEDLYPPSFPKSVQSNFDYDDDFVASDDIHVHGTIGGKKNQKKVSFSNSVDIFYY